MSEMSFDSTSAPELQLPEVKVRLNSTDRATAESSLREITDTFGDAKVIFLKVGSDLYAVKEGEDPGKFKSFIRRHLGFSGPYSANDDAGKVLAELFPNGAGSKLQSKMNSFWFSRKQAVDSREFTATLDRDIADRTQRLRAHLDDLNTPRSSLPYPLNSLRVPDRNSKHPPKLLNDTHRACVDHLDELNQNYHKNSSKDGYHQVVDQLAELEQRYVQLNDGKPLVRSIRDKLFDIDSPIHMLNRNTAGAYWMNKLAEQQAAHQNRMLDMQTPELVEDITRIFGNTFIGKQGCKEIANAGLANSHTFNRAMSLARANNQREFNAFAYQVYTQARIENLRSSLNDPKRLGRTATDNDLQSLKGLQRKLKDVEYLPTTDLRNGRFNSIGNAVDAMRERANFKNALFEKLEGNLLDSEFDEIFSAHLNHNEILKDIDNYRGAPNGLAEASRNYVNIARHDRESSYLKAELKHLQSLDIDSTYADEIQDLKSDLEEVKPPDLIKLQRIHGRVQGLRSVLQSDEAADNAPIEEKLSMAFQGVLLSGELQEVQNAGLATHHNLRAVNTSGSTRVEMKKNLMIMARFQNNRQALSRRIMMLMGNPKPGAKATAKRMLSELEELQELVDSGQQLDKVDSSLRGLAVECEKELQKFPSEDEKREWAQQPDTTS